MTIAAEVLRVLPGPDEEPISAREVWRRHGLGAIQSTKENLWRYADQGTIERIRGTSHMYRPSKFRRRP